MAEPITSLHLPFSSDSPRRSAALLRRREHAPDFLAFVSDNGPVSHCSASAGRPSARCSWTLATWLGSMLAFSWSCAR